MRSSTTLGLVLSAMLLQPLEDASGQGGALGRNRGRAREVLERYGNAFVSVSLPTGEEVDRFDQSDFVKAAGEAKELALLYVSNPKGDANAHRNFETTLFTNEELLIALRRFRCGVLDLTEHPVTLEAYEKQLPLFLAYDSEGKRVGELSLRGYKANAGGLVALLERASRGHGKLATDAFVKRYRSFLNEYDVLLGRKRAVEQQKESLDPEDARDRAKTKKLEKELAQIEEEEQDLLGEEAELLDAARVPERPAGARRLGTPWGGRRGA